MSNPRWSVLDAWQTCLCPLSLRPLSPSPGVSGPNFAQGSALDTGCGTVLTGLVPASLPLVPGCSPTPALGSGYTHLWVGRLHAGVPRAGPDWGQEGQQGLEVTLVAAKPHSPQEKPERASTYPRLTLAFLTQSLASVNSFLVTVSVLERAYGPGPAPFFYRWSHRPWQVKWFARGAVSLGHSQDPKRGLLIPRLPQEAWGGDLLFTWGQPPLLGLGNSSWLEREDRAGF